MKLCLLLRGTGCPGQEPHNLRNQPHQRHRAEREDRPTPATGAIRSRNAKEYSSSEILRYIYHSTCFLEEKFHEPLNNSRLCPSAVLRPFSTFAISSMLTKYLATNDYRAFSGPPNLDPSLESVGRVFVVTAANFSGVLSPCSREKGLLCTKKRGLESRLLIQGVRRNDLIFT